MASDRHNSNQISASTLNPPNNMMARTPQPASASFLAEENSPSPAVRARHMRATLAPHRTAAARSPPMIQSAPNQLSGALPRAFQLAAPPCQLVMEVTIPTYWTVLRQLMRSKMPLSKPNMATAATSTILTMRSML